MRNPFQRHDLFLAVLLCLCCIPVGCHDTEQSVEPSYNLEIVSGADQTGEAGRDLPEPITVRVTTPGPVPAPGVLVEFTVRAGGGTLSASSMTADENGEASVVWTLGSPPVPNQLAVRVPGSALLVFARAEPGDPPLLNLLRQGPAGTASENIAFSPGRGLFLGTSGGLLSMARPDDPLQDVPLIGEPVSSPLGFAFDGEGDLYLCENAPGSTALKRIRPNGLCEILSEGHDGQPFALPNYVAVHSSGEIFVSSTCDDTVYRVSPHDGSTVEVLSITAPNGIAFNEDESYLYILTENPLFFCSEGLDVPGGLYRSGIQPDLTAGPVEPLVEDFAVAGDGLAFDAEGNLYCVFSGLLDGTLDGLLTSAIFVYAEDGGFYEYVGVNLPCDIFTNIAFGLDPFDPFSLYGYGFTGRLYHLDVGIRGLPLP